MARNIKFALVLAIIIYTFIFISTTLFTKRLDFELIRMWGFGLSLLFILGSFPLHKTLLNASKSSGTAIHTFTPANEMHRQQVIREYDAKTGKKGENSQQIFVFAALIMILITIVLAVLF
ncbi:hypothetical protein [Bacillus alkalicellulosilyticus]|uniref:hypothetical protein n=1 Tax=Alkalihalobacterium alkalicellulosilyticum TaxID=1912214 RepID=UPI00099663A3|nr:hypothetical protein [Bacillus alkalicellulosilyticus]